MELNHFQQVEVAALPAVTVPQAVANAAAAGGAFLNTALASGDTDIIIKEGGKILVAMAQICTAFGVELENVARAGLTA